MERAMPDSFPDRVRADHRAGALAARRARARRIAAPGHAPHRRSPRVAGHPGAPRAAGAQTPSAAGSDWSENRSRKERPMATRPAHHGILSEEQSGKREQIVG